MMPDQPADHPDDAATTASVDGRQRIDKWLWFVRVIKSRTLAATLVTQGKVRVNRERVEKASFLVKPGDVLTVGIGDHVRILEVVAPGARRGPAAEAAHLFKDLTPPKPPRPTPAEVPSKPTASRANSNSRGN
jgi:ribosome-associated heat shock protein Hsp15